MATSSRIGHGGDLAEARRLFPNAPEPWIDLSTGISPVSYPLPAVPASLWQRLPGAEEERALAAAARRAYGVPAGAGLVAAPGTQMLIELLPRLVAAPAEVAVLGPTYAEHAHAWAKAGLAVRTIARPEEGAGCGVVVVVNPNNPDGRVVAPADLAAMAGALERRGGLLVVDEAFADLEPGVSIVPHLPPATLVLRSFGKTYGLAGLRLGFAIGAPAAIERLRSMLGPWAVSGPALHVGRIALDDAAWLDRVRRERAADAARLDRLLARVGTVVGGTALFRLVETTRAPELFVRLGSAGLYVRRFAQAPERLRFGLPGDEAAWARLDAALR